MKRSILVVLVLLSILVGSLYAQQRGKRPAVADNIGSSKITLYSGGQVVRTWTQKGYASFKPGETTLTISDQTSLTHICGTIVVEHSDR